MEKSSFSRKEPKTLTCTESIALPFCYAAVLCACLFVTRNFILAAGSSWSLFPIMAPPLNVVINGERKTLVVCVVNDVSEDTSGVVWFSNGNGSMLESFTYTASGEGDYGFSTVSQLAIHTKEFESWKAVTCYVAQNETSRMWNTTSLQISGIYQSKKQNKNPYPKST